MCPQKLDLKDDTEEGKARKSPTMKSMGCKGIIKTTCMCIWGEKQSVLVRLGLLASACCFWQTFCASGITCSDWLWSISTLFHVHLQFSNQEHSLFFPIVHSQLTYCSQICRPHLLKASYSWKDPDYRSRLKILPLMTQLELYVLH